MFSSKYDLSNSFSKHEENKAKDSQWGSKHPMLNDMNSGG
jgi:hypothetical protein